MKQFTAGVLAALLITAALAIAEEKPRARAVLPVVKIEKGEQCVEPVDEMRRNHMKMLLHQRDRTVHAGIRTTRHSLKNCIDCHANAKTNSVLGKDGFCESCHTYAAVSLDCFECHSPSPRVPARADKPVAPLPAVAQKPARGAALVAPVAAGRVDGNAP